MSCRACPFAFTDESERIQNYGCLPSPYEIMQMKKNTGHTWGCHEDDEAKTKCRGFMEYMKLLEKCGKEGFDFDIGGIIKYKTWVHDGEEAALKEAEQNG